MLDQEVYKPKNVHGGARFSSSRRHAMARKSSISGYMVAATAAAFALFFLLWWMLQSEDTPWVPAGLAASVVMLVAASARGVLMRRSFMQRLAEQEKHGRYRDSNLRSASRGRNFHSISIQSEALRLLQKRAAETEARDSMPEDHLAVYRLCVDYLASAEEALLSPALPSENRLGLIAGQERVKTLQRRHLLAWARGEARSLTHEAQQRVRLHEKVEVANRALDCIDSALKVYPDAAELDQSAGAVREFITSSRVAHWVELAERAAFKGYYRRAIDCYRDALFYLTRDRVDQNREAAAQQIAREIDLLRARLDTQSAGDRIVEATARVKTRRKKKA
jgi:tetratricopeptide (TPR) repeat protein